MGFFSRRWPARSTFATPRRASAPPNPRASRSAPHRHRRHLAAGLDETVWPPQARTDAFLNRPMRAALGLTPPERKLGQTAHDFVQAMGKRKVILSRARKREGAPAVASRFLQRMAALGGKTWDACRERGEFYLQFAREIDLPREVAPPGERPLPRPKVELRPKRLSVTQIETLRRDPYALYAEKILAPESPRSARRGGRSSRTLAARSMRCWSAL